MDKNKIRDLTGKKFGKLLVIKIADKELWKTYSKTKRVSWVCKCDCGNEVIYSTPQLCYYKNKSCGCIKKEKQHFACKSNLHKTWSSMLMRCYNKKRNQFYLYGGRGIKVCDEWLGSNPKGFSNFYDWSIKNGYKQEILKNGRNKWTLDRIDVDKDYSPENCRWITNEQQQKNKRIYYLFEYNGEIKSMLSWCHKYNFLCRDYYKFLKLGYNNKQILDYISLKNPTAVQQLHNP